ncbi:hypothetical protein [Tunturiibacter gelidoferens]|uniref:Uncharacterized protein n=1 Tax=Tunturiibacter lichenicola TaxID=2051959 RepID=A0A7Y9NS22_9BACT|nr:hypothetical protein [Edaphobacter lichenicola]NYF53948.1 hypothetical protein [Edaphobacter lichenicola]
MNMNLTHAFAGRSESLAFLTLSGNDLNCMRQTRVSQDVTRKSAARYTPTPVLSSQEDKARIALCQLIEELGKSGSADEFIARRERLFQRYVDLMLGLGRIAHALNEGIELVKKIKEQLYVAETFYANAAKEYCPPHLKDQAIFSLWELGKVVDLADFINSRPPVPENKREEDQRFSGVCTIELLFGRLHLDCLAYAISAKRVLPDDMQELLNEGMRHFVNGHVAIRFGARLRQEIVDDSPVELIPLDEEDRLDFAYSMAGREDEEY